MKIKISEPLRLEHKELHIQLAEATKVNGGLGATSLGFVRTLY